MVLSSSSSFKWSQLPFNFAGYTLVWLASASLLLVLFLNSAVAKSKKPDDAGIHKIKHVIVIMQENRSFDSYFGTFPGAEGLPMEGGVPTVCNPDPKTGECVQPYHDAHDANGGGPHGEKAAIAAINGGKMDGFVSQSKSGRKGCNPGPSPVCDDSSFSDVMGYHDERDLPNYWAYARKFVLQDHMFEPNASWSLPEHLFQVSAWSAFCSEHNKPESCTNQVQAPGMPPDFRGRSAPAFGGEARNGPAGTRPIYAWTDLTYLLHKNHVSWGYYVVKGTEPDCEDDSQVNCPPVKQNARTPGIWNPLPYFDTVNNDGELDRVQAIENFYEQARKGTLTASCSSRGNACLQPSAAEYGPIWI